MLETIGIAVASNLAFSILIYGLIRYVPRVRQYINKQYLDIVQPEVTLPESAEEREQPLRRDSARVAKVCAWCDETISKKARRCPYCTTNLGAHGG